jgi:hypothetical protein
MKRRARSRIIDVKLSTRGKAHHLIGVYNALTSSGIGQTVNLTTTLVKFQFPMACLLQVV